MFTVKYYCWMGFCVFTGTLSQNSYLAVWKRILFIQLWQRDVTCLKTVTKKNVIAESASQLAPAYHLLCLGSKYINSHIMEISVAIPVFLTINI